MLDVQTILVTGGAGFIGSRLVRRLVDEGHRVVVADNLTTARSTYLLDGVLDRIEFVHLDVRCPEDFALLPRGGWDRVFHLAASFANARSIDHPELDERTNVAGTTNVIRFAERAGCGLLVYTGSSSSYGDAPVPFAEDGPMHPATPYAITKLRAERLVEECVIPSAIFRLFNVYGPGDPPGVYRNAIPNMLKALERPEGSVRIFGAEATRDFTFVEDAVSVLVRPEPAIGRVVNVGAGFETPVAEVAQILLRMMDRPADRMHVVPRRPWDRVVRRAADVSKLRALYGEDAVPATPLEDGLARTVRWLSEVGHLQRPR